LVLVEHYHYDSGDDPLYWADVETIIKFGTWLLYLEIFLFGIVSMFYLDYSFTFAYLGAILGMFYLHLIWEQYGKREREDTETNTEAVKCG